MRGNLLTLLLLSAAATSAVALTHCVGDDSTTPQDAQSDGTTSDASDGGGPEASLVPLSVSLDGGGAGVVTSAPTGINCGTQCTASFASGTSVTLTAMPDASSSVFAGWTSGDCTGDGTCVLTVDKAKTAEATFQLHGSHRWIDTVSFPGADSPDYVAVDSADNVIVAGMVVPVASGPSVPYVRKYSNDGKMLWDKQIPTDCFASDGGLAVDSAGNIYFGASLSGFNNNCTTFGGVAATGDFYGDIAVARLAAADGHVDWVKEFGGAGQDRPHALAVNGTNLYVTGESDSSPATFGGYSFSQSMGSGFLAKLDTGTGSVTYAKSMPGNMQIWDIAASATDVLVVGQFRMNMVIDGIGINVSSGAHSDVMIYDFAATNPMTAQWAKGVGDTTGDDAAYSAAAAPGGGWVVTGGFFGNANFAGVGTSLTSAGGSDVFLARYDATGNYVYQFGYGGTGTDLGDSVAFDSNGNLFMAGRFATNITFGSYTLTGASNTDTFLTRLSAGTTPVHQWAAKYGGTAYDLTRDLAVDSKGNPFVLAQWTGMTVVDGVSLTSQDYDGWILAAWR